MKKYRRPTKKERSKVLIGKDTVIGCFFSPNITDSTDLLKDNRIRYVDYITKCYAYMSVEQFANSNARLFSQKKDALC